MSHVYIFGLLSQAFIFISLLHTRFSSSLAPLNFKNVELYQLFLTYSGLKDIGLACRRGDTYSY